MLAMLEGSDLLILAVIVLVLFGGSQLPKLARSLGEAQKELKKAMNDDAPKGGSSKDGVDGDSSVTPTAAPPVSTAPAAEVPPTTDTPATAPLNGTAPSEAPKADTP